MEPASSIISKIKTTTREHSKCKKHDIMCDVFIMYPWNDEVAGETCTKCRSEEKEREAKEDADRKDRSIQRIIENANMPPRFKDKTFDNYKITNKEQRGIISSIKEFCETDGKNTGLIFIGKPGTGKNHLACAMVTHLAYEKHLQSCIITASKLIRSIKDSWRDKETSEEYIIKRYTESPLLIIDEIGVQFGSDTEKLYLTEIINDRYENYRPTILIGNVTMQQLSDQLGERIIDRFKEGGKVLVFDWESHRGK